MDVEQIRQLPAQLERFLQSFGDCVARSEGREHLRRYTSGQLADLPGKTVQHLAEASGRRAGPSGNVRPCSAKGRGVICSTTFCR